MQSRRRRIVKWSLGAVAVLFALFAGYVAFLFHPGFVFSHQRDFGDYRVYADEAIGDEFAEVIDDIDRRLRAMEHGPPTSAQRIYLCDPPTFRLFASLTRRNPRSLGIGLSVANESFVSLSTVERFAAANAGALRHTRFEASIAEVVAHEIAHFNSVDALGYRAHLRLPLWKSEGWAEYQANLAAIRSDPDYDLARRIDKLLDAGYWGGQQGMARYFWETQLMVEYLGEIEGFGLTDLAQDEVTEGAVRERMMAWYRDARKDPAG